MAAAWKFGRGKLGRLAPLLGAWKAEADSPMGPVHCERRFERVLDGEWVRLSAHWRIGAGAQPKLYEELTVFGPGPGGVEFWAFASDGKRSHGREVAAPDIHPQVLAFEAEVPAGLARMLYWPDAEGGWRWAVEARNKAGWKRFSEHHYLPLEQA